MIVFLLGVHLIICIAVYILMKLSVLKCPKTIMPIVLLVPLWGFCVMILLELRTRDRKPKSNEVGIEQLKINDFVYRSILVDDESAKEHIVPLEEALLINKPATRRELMMEIMYDEPNDYVNLLKEARMNDDTEVVHYAVTALVELQKEYDLQFQNMDWKMKQEPENVELMDEYLQLLDRYLSSNIAEGNDRKLKLQTYSEILRKKISLEPQNLGLRKDKVQVDLRLGNLNDMYQDIEYILRNWPSDETGYMLMMQYFSNRKNREGMKKVMQLIEKKNIHLTPDGRRQVQFWKGNEGESEE